MSVRESSPGVEGVASRSPQPSQSDALSALVSKVVGIVERDRREGVQFSLHGIRGMPQQGLDALDPTQLTSVEKALERNYLGSKVGELGLVHIEGLTFEIVSATEAELYRSDRELDAAQPVSGRIPALASNPTVVAALSRTVVVGGRGSQYAASRISDLLGLEPYQPLHLKFANRESFVRLPESIRGKHLVVVQSLVGDIDIAMASTRLLLDAASRAGVSAITLALPCLPYGRQDRRGKDRSSVTPAMLFSELEAAARGRLTNIVTIDLHSLQTEGMSGKINVDNLSGQSLFIKPLQALLAGQEFAAVFPDIGARKRATEDGFDQKLERAFMSPPKIGAMNKTRGAEKNSVETAQFEGDPEIVREKTVVFFDDMIDTGGTGLKSLEVIRRLGASRVIYCATHPLFSQCGVELFRNATVTLDGGGRVQAVDKIIVGNTVPLRRGRGELIQTVDVFPMLSHFLAGVVSNGGFSTRELADTYSGLNGH